MATTAKKTKAPAKAVKISAPKTKAPHFDGQAGYGGTGSTYKPPDTDPVKQTLHTDEPVAEAEDAE